MKLKKYLVRYTARPLPGWAQMEVHAENPGKAIAKSFTIPNYKFKCDKPHDEYWWDDAQPTAVEI